MKWIEAAKEHFILHYPQEACGLVVDIAGEYQFIACPNMATSPNQGFCIAGPDWFDAEQLGEVVGVAHSHPNDTAEPSQADRVACEGTGIPWHIFRVEKDDGTGPVVVTESRTITPVGYKAPLIGRSFTYGVLDCYALVRDWYEQELQIALPDFDHGPDAWWNDPNTPFDPFEQHFREAGFAPIKGAIQRGDIILMQIKSRSRKVNHCGVYVGNTRMLHHMYNRLSGHDVYGGYYAEVTRKIIRRES